MRPLVSEDKERWNEEKSRAFLRWRETDLHAYSMPVQLCFADQQVIDDFHRYWAIQRLIGQRK